MALGDPGQRQRHRQHWLETAIIFAAWTVYGLLLASQLYMQAELRGQPVGWTPLLRSGLLDSYLWAFTTLAIFWLARRVPLERSGLTRRIGVHLVAAYLERRHSGRFRLRHGFSRRQQIEEAQKVVGVRESSVRQRKTRILLQLQHSGYIPITGRAH